MNYKKFVQRLFMIWGLSELAIIILAIFAYWTDTTINMNDVVGDATIGAAVGVGLIFLIVTIITVKDND
jgi:hypothetical protein